jgi:hypothetical protein
MTLLKLVACLLQAPVPFLVGMQHKTEDVRALVGGLVRVNVGKDKVCPVDIRNHGSHCA